MRLLIDEESLNALLNPLARHSAAIMFRSA